MYRLFWFFHTLHSLFCRRYDINEKVSHRFIVLPLIDTDVRYMHSHMYLKYLDLCRWIYVIKSDLIKVFVKNKMIPTIQSQNIEYIRPLKACMRFNVTTQVVFWNGYYVYMENTFTHNDIVYARAYSKLKIKTQKSAVKMEDILVYLQQPELKPIYFGKEKMIQRVESL